MTQEKKVAVVTGSSSGIGYEITARLLLLGYTVYGLSRRGTVPEGAHGLKADVSKKNEVDEAINTVIDNEGRIDILIANAGMGISGPVEFTAQDAMEKITEINFYGQVYSSQAVLATMRKQSNGHIIFISSVAAPIAIPYQGFYSATKSAVCSIALALRNEVKDFNIKVTCIQPGDCSTGFTDSREKNQNYDDIYTANSKATMSMEKDEREGIPAHKAAKQIVDIALKENPKPIYIIGFKYKLFALLFRILPARLSYTIVSHMYG